MKPRELYGLTDCQQTSTLCDHWQAGKKMISTSEQCVWRLTEDRSVGVEDCSKEALTGKLMDRRVILHALSWLSSLQLENNLLPQWRMLWCPALRNNTIRRILEVNHPPAHYSFMSNFQSTNVSALKAWFSSWKTIDFDIKSELGFSFERFHALYK